MSVWHSVRVFGNVWCVALCALLSASCGGKSERTVDVLRPTPEWLVTWGDASSDVVTDIALDENAVYVGGVGRLSLDPTMSDTVSAYVARFDAKGNLEWTQRVQKSVEYSVVYVALASDGALYASGRCEPGADLDPGPGADPAPDGARNYVSKFARDGIYLWSRAWPGMSSEPRIAALPNGGVAVAATLSNPGVRPVATAFGLSSDGDELWRTTWSGNHFNAPAGIVPDQEGVFVCGWYSEQRDGLPGDMPVSRGADGFVLRLGADGERLWLRTWGGGYDDFVQDCALGETGTLAVVGSFSLSSTDGSFTLADGTQTTLQTDDYDALLYAFSDTGEPLRLRSWGGPARDLANSVTPAPGGDFLVASVAEVLGLDAASSTLDAADGPFASVIRFSPDAGTVSALTWGSNGNTSANAVSALDGQAVIGGSFDGAVRFPDAGEPSAVAFSDAFLWRREAPQWQ